MPAPAAATIARLHRLGIKTLMATGDIEAAARHVAGLVGIDRVEPQYFSLCAEIDLTPDADADRVAAEIAFTVDRFMAPPVFNYTLAEMRQRRLRQHQASLGRSDVQLQRRMARGQHRFITVGRQHRGALGREALRDGRIAAAGLDVYENEPALNSPSAPAPGWASGSSRRSSSRLQ